MAYIFYNSNPLKMLVGDCVVRGISTFTDESWDDIYLGLCLQGYIEKDMPSSNAVWGKYLYKKGYRHQFNSFAYRHVFMPPKSIIQKVYQKINF